MSPILESPIGLGSVPFLSGNVPRPGFHLIVFPLLFPLWEEFSPLVPAFLGTFPGVFPFCFLFLRGIFPFLDIFPGGDSSGQEVSWLRLLVPFRSGTGVSSIHSLSRGKGIPFSIIFLGRAPARYSQVASESHEL